MAPGIEVEVAASNDARERRRRKDDLAARTVHVLA